jgi:hypothetical protein
MVMDARHAANPGRSVKGWGFPENSGTPDPELYRVRKFEGFLKAK